MIKNFRITVDGRSYDVAVEDLDQPATAPAFVPAVSVVHAAPAAAAAPTSHPVAAQAAEAGAGTIVAPLGGVVFSIDVAVGQNVAVNDKVATIEAMKMKTEVMSKVAGTVKSIAVNVAESVETGQVLMTVE
jgi:biotin carboxyl carrier protein